jgi:threonine 3-dehydrogenase
MSKMMTAVVKTEAEENGTVFQDVPVPKPGPNSVLIEVKVASICGTDAHIWNWDDWAANRIKLPLVYGHEFVGNVVEIGSDVEHVKIDDYVSGECHLACGHCFNCRSGMMHVCKNTRIFGVDRDGAFAKYICIPKYNVWHNELELSPDICSIQDPLGNAIHTIFSADCIGKDVAVIGVGPIGAMAVAVLKHIGASQIFAIGRRNQYRIDMAKEVGADFALSSLRDDVKGTVMEATDGKGMDVVLEMAGNPDAVTMGLDIMRTGGNISLLGVYSKPLTIDLSTQVVFKYATIRGINGRLMYDTWYRMADLLKNKALLANLNKIITHRIKLSEFQKGMEIMRSGDSGKIVMKVD